jgi:hypothetical protein
MEQEKQERKQREQEEEAKRMAEETMERRAEEKRKFDACQGKLMEDAADCLGKYIKPVNLRRFHWLARLACWCWAWASRYI